MRKRHFNGGEWIITLKMKKKKRMREFSDSTQIENRLHTTFFNNLSYSFFFIISAKT